MIVSSDRIVVTAAVLDWVEADRLRMVWLAGCLARHLTADWGEPLPSGRGLVLRAVG